MNVPQSCSTFITQLYSRIDAYEDTGNRNQLTEIFQYICQNRELISRSKNVIFCDNFLNGINALTLVNASDEQKLQLQKIRLASNNYLKTFSHLVLIPKDVFNHILTYAALLNSKKHYGVKQIIVNVYKIAQQRLVMFPKETLFTEWSCTHLTHQMLLNAQIPEELVETMMPELTHMELSAPNIVLTPQHEEYFPNLYKHLQLTTLKKNEKITIPKMDELICPPTSLRSFNIELPVSSAAYGYLQKQCSTLQTMHIQFERKSWKDIQKGIAQFTQLNSLELFDSEISKIVLEYDLDFLKSLTSLTNLYLGFGSYSQRPHFEVLTKFTGLTYLGLEDIKPTELDTVSFMTQLKTLNLSKNRMRGRTEYDLLNKISNLTQLENLTMGHIESLGDLKYDDLLISSFSKLTNLVHLDLSHLEFKVQDLTSFAHLRCLRIRLDRVPTTEEYAQLSAIQTLQIPNLNKLPLSLPSFSSILKRSKLGVEIFRRETLDMHEVGGDEIVDQEEPPFKRQRLDPNGI